MGKSWSKMQQPHDSHSSETQPCNSSSSPETQSPSESPPSPSRQAPRESSRSPSRQPPCKRQKKADTPKVQEHQQYGRTVQQEQTVKAQSDEREVKETDSQIETKVCVTGEGDATRCPQRQQKSASPPISITSSSLDHKNTDDEDLVDYWPVCSVWQHAVAEYFSLPVKEQTRCHHVPRRISSQAKPVCRPTKADGNCLFHALSAIVFGNENYHVEMRAAIVAFMLQHGKLLQCILEAKYKNMRQYIEEQRVSEEGSWGGTEELAAFSILTDTPVFLHTPSGWLPINPVVENNLPTITPIDTSQYHRGEAVYLRWAKNHFESVLRA